MRRIASRQWPGVILALGLFAGTGTAPAAPSVYPVGTTIYAPAETWNGYTVLSLSNEGSIFNAAMKGFVDGTRKNLGM